MPEMHRLTAEERRALERYEAARDWTLRFELRRLAARARVRVAGAAAHGLDPERRAHARRLAALTHRIASGYERLVHLDGAIRFSRWMARKAKRRLAGGTA